MLDLARFALRLLCGMSLVWCLLPRRQISSGFFRIQMLVALGLAVLAAMAAGAGAAGAAASGSWSVVRGLCGGLAGVAFIGSVLWTLERRRGGTAAAVAIACLATATLVLAGLPGAGGGPRSAAPMAALHAAAELTAAGLLGAAVTGMLLGHWYLTAPGMPLEPLQRANWLLAAATGLRIVCVAAAIVIGPPAATWSGTIWLWMVLRLVAGLLGPLVAAVMVRRILKYRNTQAATGVLFVAVILTFIGEMTGMLLQRELGVPL
ncbi:MAG: hypothetical protein KY476_00210 [Planctomycetes bacterium]|nr:hypothetical protein [Planctomycetota bacterium]